MTEPSPLSPASILAAGPDANQCICPICSAQPGEPCTDVRDGILIDLNLGIVHSGRVTGATATTATTGTEGLLCACGEDGTHIRHRRAWGWSIPCAVCGAPGHTSHKPPRPTLYDALGVQQHGPVARRSRRIGEFVGITLVVCLIMAGFGAALGWLASWWAAPILSVLAYREAQRARRWAAVGPEDCPECRGAREYACPWCGE